MERLTKRFTDGTFYCEDIEDVGIKGINAPTYVGKAVDKLANYEDAEEQGLLLRLPCKVGDTVWVIDEDNEHPGKKKIYEAKWKRVTIVQVAENHPFELRGEVIYQVYDYFYNDGRTMLSGMYVGQIHTKVGEVVFLTKEEAEQALEEMKGE